MDNSNSSQGNIGLDTSVNKDSIRLSAKEAGKFLVVGIGASAGGVKALRELFENISGDSGCAYVVILHLSPDFESRLSEILQAKANIPIQQVTNPVKLQANQGYVIAPGMCMQLADGMLTVKPVSSYEERRAPIDIFFRTLADTHDARAVSVVLSGTGSDGSMGIKRVKERGGIIMVQRPDEAEYKDMPLAAIETNLVDYCLPVKEMPQHIFAYRKHLAKVQLPERDEDENYPAREEEEENALHEIYTQLRVKTGHDFVAYKRATVMRRIARRMSVRELDSLKDYVVYLRAHSEEAEALLKDLLISVTNFFRDKEAFAYVEQHVVPALLKGKTGDDVIRIWVTACATGEEAYSLAMLFTEQMSVMSNSPRLQIFATDIDNDAIATSREALYTNADVADVSPERLQRFFTKESDDVYRVRRELRECILFAQQNILRDPPFSHLSFVSCRNLLIYLMRTAQQRVMQTLHFSLDPGGFLMLGSAESIDGSGDLFVTVDREQCIYQSRAVTNRPVPPVPEIPFAYRSPILAGPAAPASAVKNKEKLSLTTLHYQLLEHYAPPSVLVNAEYEIIHVSDRAGEFMHVAGGEPSYNLLKVVRPELRMELRAALHGAVTDHTVVRTSPVTLQLAHGPAAVAAVVRPVADPADTARGFLLVLFEKSEALAEEIVPLAGGPEGIAMHLEQELSNTRMQLRTTTEQFEVQTEELRASNEELQAINEELRSAAEELETGKEELQSVNEELTTVNQELKTKIEELSHANNDFQNLMSSTDIGTVFLDRSLNVKLFTPTARDIFNLLPGDVNRPLSDITHHLQETDLMEDAIQVMQRLIPIEREVHSGKGEAYLMRLSPYRADHDRIAGVIVTFINITRRVQAEEELRKGEVRFRTMANAIPQLIWTNEAGGIANYFNQRWYEYSGLTYEASFGLGWQAIVHPEDAATAVAKWQDALKTGGEFESEIRLRRHDGVYRWFIGRNVPLRDDNGRVLAWFGSATDIEDVKRAQASLASSEERLRVTMDSAVDYAILTTDTENIIGGWSTGAERIFGYTEAEAIGQPGSIVFTPEDIAAGAPEKEIKMALTEGRAIDERWHMRRDGRRFYMSGIMRPIMNPEHTGFVKVARDITEQKLTEQLKDEFLGIASHELKTPVTSIKAYAEVLEEMFRDLGDLKSAGMMQKMDKQIDRLSDLIRSLLDVTRISQGGLELVKEHFDLSTLLEEVVEQMQHATQQQLIIEAGANAEVYADRGRIGQVLSNLISNAIKYSPDGRQVYIRTKLNRERQVVICVQDFGIGMSDEVRTKVFERFYRANGGIGNTYPGLGLGLYISAEIVQGHGGSIWVESQEQKGSTFCFSLPLGE